MKKSVLFLFALLLNAGVLFGQSNKEDVDIIQSVFGKQKKELVASFVQVDAAKADAFWKLYDEYETSRKALGQKRIALLERYAAKYTTLDDAAIDGIVKDTQSLQVETDKLIVQYYNKIKKVTGSKAAAQFYQFEGYLLSVIRATIMNNIPLIGELDPKK